MATWFKKDKNNDAKKATETVNSGDVQNEEVKSEVKTDSDSSATSQTSSADKAEAKTDEPRLLGSRRVHRLKKHAETKLAAKTKIPFAAVIAASVVVVLIIVLSVVALVRRPSSFTGFFAGDYKASAVKEFQMYSSRQVKDIQNEVQSFAVNDPILLKLQLKAENAPESITYIVNDAQGNKVRGGTLPISKGNDGEDIVRYISIVTGSRTTLAAGKYVCIIQDSTNADDPKNIAQYTFTISDSKAPKETPTPEEVQEQNPIPATVTSDSPTEEATPATEEIQETPASEASETPSENAGN